MLFYFYQQEPFVPNPARFSQNLYDSNTNGHIFILKLDTRHHHLQTESVQPTLQL